MRKFTKKERELHGNILEVAGRKRGTVEKNGNSED